MQKSLEASTNLKTLCPDLVRELFEYDKTTGVLTHRFRARKHFKTERALILGTLDIQINRRGM